MTTWLEAVVSGRASDAPVKSDEVTDQAVTSWLGALNTSAPCQHIAGRLTLAKEDMEGHDSMLKSSASLIAFGAQGCSGVPAALNELHQTFLSEVKDRRKRGQAESEWRRAIEGAVRLAYQDHPVPETECLHAPSDVRTPPVAGGAHVSLVSAADVQLEHIWWLRDGQIPLRVVTLVVGVDGVGKSTYIYNTAALATRGLLPGDRFGKPTKVLITSVEDHVSSVIVPRLMAAGADLDKVSFLRLTGADGIEGDITLPDDIQLVSETMAAGGFGLLTIDPLAAYISLKFDTHKQQHLRRLVAPLAKMAEDLEAAILGVVHFNGSQGTDVRSRISMSKAIRDASRSCLVCGVHPENPAGNRFVIVQDKPSLGGRRDQGWVYDINETEVVQGGERFKATRIDWQGEIQMTAAELIAVREFDPDEKSQRDEAKDAIRLVLESGRKVWNDIETAVRREAACSQRTARRARDDLKRIGEIDSQKVPGNWLWFLVNQTEVADSLPIPSPVSPRAIGAPRSAPVTAELALESSDGVCPECSMGDGRHGSACAA